MSGFQSPITVETVLKRICAGDLAMPAIQRDYEWTVDQVYWLFDSLMRQYPISSFLLWEVRGTNVGQYKFYKFLREFREDFQIRGEERIVNEQDRFMAVLDGQQRLTSLYIGFYGSYAWRVAWGRRDSDTEISRPTRKLYLNLSRTFAPDEDEQGRLYNFQFKAKDESENFADIFRDSKDNQWFRVGKALALEDFFEIKEFIDKHALDRSAQKVLSCLLNIKRAPAINYYLEDDSNLQKALEIFIRINKGGAPLSISTIILSIAISYWQRDAKREFDKLRSAVTFEGFSINNDFILKAFLYLHSSDIKFKVTNFKHETAELLEQNWDNLYASIVETFRTIRRFGYNDQCLPAHNVLMPIVYFIYHKQYWNGFADRIQYSQERKQIQNWLNKAVVHRIVGSSSDAILAKIRRAFTDDISIPLKLSPVGFPAAKIRELLGPAMAISDEFLESLIHLQKDDKFTFAALALLFPHLDYRNEFHKDHMHPKTAFENCKKATIQEVDKEFFEPYWWNSIVNLQMLDGNENESKSGRSLSEWIKNEVETKGNDLNSLCQRCIIPANISLEFKDFPSFARARKEALKERFKQVLS